MPKLNSISWKILQCILEKEGFIHARTEGDHMVFTRAGSLRPVVIPKYASLPVFIIKNNLRTAGISRELYFELLAKCQ